MNIRRLAIGLTLLALCGSAQAQPSSFSAVTPERVAELEAMHQQAIEFLLKNDFQGAIQAYSDILLLEPDDETAYTGLGQIYMIQGRYQEAHRSFQNALHINADNQVALAGIRKIMDPDGSEGVTSRGELEAEEAAGPLRKPAARVEALSAPAPAPHALAEKRQSAVKAKKGPATAGTVSATVPAPVRRAPATPPRLGRLGLLNAQRTQMALRNAGYYEGPVNGLIGSSTKNAIREFQKSFGIEASGRMTPVTWSKLSEYLSTP